MKSSAKDVGLDSSTNGAHNASSENASKTKASATASNANFSHAKHLSTSAKQDLTDN
jgi:hypothetical protein